MTVRFGIIGCGSISRFHFAGLATAKATIVRVCDLDAAKAEGWARQTGATACTDWREVIADPAVEAVVVATISSLHKDICLAAIAAGKAVVCEKTLATSAADAWAIVSAAERRGTLLYTSYMKRWFEAAQQARRLLPSLGRIVSTHARVHQPWGGIWSQPGEGRGESPSAFRRNYGGGMLVMGGSHMLDLILFMLGRPDSILATMHVPADRDIDLQASALLQTAEHGVIHFEALASPLGRVGFLRDGWDESLEITGTGGRLTLLTSTWNQVEQKTALLRHYDEASGQSHEYRFAVISPFERAIGAFVADIAAGTQRAQSRLTGYEVDELIATIVASAASGRRETVPWRCAPAR